MQEKTLALTTFFPVSTSKGLLRAVGAWLDEDETRKVKDIYAKMRISKQAFYQFLHPKRTLKLKTLESIRLAMGYNKTEFYRYFGLKIGD